jgi:hypothetical protein
MRSQLDRIAKGMMNVDSMMKSQLGVAAMPLEK